MDEHVLERQAAAEIEVEHHHRETQSVMISRAVQSTLLGVPGAQVERVVGPVQRAESQSAEENQVSRTSGSCDKKAVVLNRLNDLLSPGSLTQTKPKPCGRLDRDLSQPALIGRSRYAIGHLSPTAPGARQRRSLETAATKSALTPHRDPMPPTKAAA